MKACRRLFYFVGSLLLLNSCSQSDEVSFGEEENLTVVISSSPMSDGDLTTRVTVDVSSSNVSFPFNENDTVGIFPSQGDQVSFPLSGNSGSTSSTFNGGGWGLKSGMTYYSYIPFNRKNFSSYDQKNKIPVSFLGQVQDGFNNTDGIGNYVYMTSEGVTPTEGLLQIQLRHVGFLGRIGFTFPVTGTFTQVCIVSEDDVFPTTGTIDLESNSTTISPVTYSNKMVLSLKNVKITSSDLSKSYNFYMMFPPCDCSGKSLKIVLVDSYGNTYTTNTRVGKNNNFESGHYYGFTTTESFVKEQGTVNNDGGNIGFLVETDNMTNEDVQLNF